MEHKQLRCFVMVAETLHFGRAVRQMDMVPASFGRQIRLLEEHLGCRLLERTTRHATLTPAGAEFRSGAREIVDRTNALATAFREGRNTPTPILRVGAIDSAALGLTPQLLPRFREAHPEFDVELMEQKTIRLPLRFLCGRLDLTVVRAPETADLALAFRYLFHETAVVAMPAGHRLAQRTWSTPTEVVHPLG
ncbi:MAG: LysR family transcriptional regulator [Pseudomonadota bacterium]